ncbi:MAG: hypothetical protein AB7F19_05430 [Candidatus Babeliales bacterium]
MKKNIVLYSLVFYVFDVSAYAWMNLKQRAQHLALRKEALQKERQERKEQRLAQLRNYYAEQAQLLAQKKCEQEQAMQEQKIVVAHKEALRVKAAQEKEAERIQVFAQREEARIKAAQEKEMQQQQLLAQRQVKQQRIQEQNALKLAQRQQEQQAREAAKALQLAQRACEKEEAARQQALIMAQKESERKQFEEQKALQLAERKKEQERIAQEKETQRAVALAARREERQARAQARVELFAQKESERKERDAQRTQILVQKEPERTVQQESAPQQVMLTHNQEVLPNIVVQQQEPLASLVQDIAGTTLQDDRFNSLMAYAEKKLEVTRELVHTQQRVVEAMRQDLAQLTSLALGTVTSDLKTALPTPQEFQQAFDQFAHNAHFNEQLIASLLQVLEGESAIVASLEKNNRGSQLEKVIQERNALLFQSPLAVQRFYEVIMEQAFDASEQFEGKRSEYLNHMRESLSAVEQQVKKLQQTV